MSGRAAESARVPAAAHDAGRGRVRDSARAAERASPAARVAARRRA
jgi:hypothetical protein